MMRPLSLIRSAPRFARLGLSMLAAKSLPFSMTFILTHRCNFRCAYCDIPDAAGNEMSTADFCRAIDELAGIGMARASFSGGEALMRRDALDIVRHARACGLMTSLNSNAWLAERYLDALAESLDLLVVSLDGPEREHDLVRRQKGSYLRVLRVLDGARQRGIATATITVLSAQNLHVVDEVLELAERHAFYAYFQPAYEDCFRHARGLDPAIGPSVLADLASRLRQAKQAGRPVGASTGFLDRLGRGPAFGACSSCHAGRYFGTVMPDGKVVPCHLTSGDHEYPDGLRMGFDAAFRALPRPAPGPGCAISPYQETDLIFSGDVSAMTSALSRLAGARRTEG
jgi:MoaA/NifB/PqqE/SkfB family radical SAM enzyme